MWKQANIGKARLLESKAHAKVIQNATRFLTGVAKNGAVSTTSNKN
jgi:hypothetical protein